MQHQSSGDTSLRFAIVLGQRASWPELLARVRETETLGFDGLYLVDHFYGLFDVNEPTHEAWTMLGALAPFTQRLTLGVMVSGNTYRHPMVLLKQAITVDHVSGGRVIFGVGAGWTEREHEAYGVSLPPVKERVDRFAEALEMWDMLQREERSTFDGQHYQLLDAPFQPKSLQQGRLPMLIGASGNRMLRLTARHADIWNTVGTPEEAAEKNRRLDAICEEQGRDPATLLRAVSPSINLLASVDAFIAGVNAYHEAGFREIDMPWPRNEAEVPVLRQVARDIIPAMRGAGNSVSGDDPGVRTLRPIGPDDIPLLAELMAALDGDARRVLDVLIDHPDERFDAATLQRQLELERHADVARAISVIGAALAGSGLARPWNEGQRGYLLPAEHAAILRMARDNARP